MTALILLVAFLWAFAEATFFFLPADIAVAVGAATLPTRWYFVALEATAGAVAGGALLAALAERAPERVRRLVTRLPGHSEAFFEETAARFEEKGWGALLLAGLTGRPYKLFALTAGERSIPLPSFLAVSALARAIRFFPVAFAASWCVRHFGPGRVRLVSAVFAVAILAAWGVAVVASRRTGAATSEALPEPAAPSEATASAAVPEPAPEPIPSAERDADGL